MTRLQTCLLVLIVALLGALVYEVHGLNRRLDSVGTVAVAASRAFAATPSQPESPAERERRLDAAARRQHESVRDALEVLKRSLAYDEVPEATRRSTPDAGHRPSGDTPGSR